MDAATALQMSNSSAMRKARRPMSLQVAMLAQQMGVKDDPTPTDVMIYRQPASDVPVPASWRPSSPAPLDSADQPKAEVEKDEEQGYDDDVVGWESAGVSLARLHQLERHTEPRRIADRRRDAITRARISMLVLGSAVTCTLAGLATLI